MDRSAPAASGCPFHGVAPNGCPVSADAAGFDAFSGPYQLDPAEALRWSREREPVFFSPRLGYWVVTRYEDVKAVFRNAAAFSPAIALEKVTPTSEAANAILRRYDYGMNRTLVNEDEPAHMERRRALLHSFLPAELAHHEPMVRRLTREYVDRFVGRGEVDLVDEMLWEIPLTVALHFLGVPEEDMDTLRAYSIAHTVNTWGRPSPEEQLKVAEAVGKFWQYAGRVLEKMRANPAGHGWMEYAIRRQKEMPEVITDSYLHSMMMAGIVAAHETTANATANALLILLRDREAWDAICADPSLIPNAAEECLRLSGSIVAWRRLALEDVQVGGVAIPKGSKLLIVMTSANHDGRHFENPDELDIYRDNTTEHLSFGYGSHQCMGKNLARMEMRIFLEELTRRLPHMELVPDQVLDYLPNTSFRGPHHLRVRWDPSLNPERRDPALLDRRADFAVGAPAREAVARHLRVAALRPEAEGVLGLVLEDPRGRDLPRWTPGAHIDVVVGGYERKYSLCGDPEDRRRLRIAVRREAMGRGGSAHIHDAVREGDILRVRGPKNHFRLDEGAARYLLVAGGIGITPVIAMADRLKRLGKDYAIHYAGRARPAMALLERLERDHGARLHLYPADEGRRLDIQALVVAAPGDAQVYACGPDRMLAALERTMAADPGRLHVEHFAAAGTHLEPSVELPFEVELRDSGLTLQVPADRTLLQTLHAAGIDVPSDCGEGLCGSCEVQVLAGEVDHRDKVLGAAERAGQDRMMACCSRACGRKIVLAL
ncbi:cytochrome P450/oxidoreductase [Roseomonas sp. NAR14]|uniref:Cytochrome P450/oxidoreductase n=1 Tax=Roseomonas acroporae TaxID=2937791 RepID=A0A9X2BUT2_9PROT|nr:cytochrome P450/oxidoreductase [Roseomonas acroporae]MCK8783299.1 cytochrome P450/oxidoreductase [Roseomonas acroporae]